MSSRRSPGPISWGEEHRRREWHGSPVRHCPVERGTTRAPSCRGEPSRREGCGGSSLDGTGHLLRLLSAAVKAQRALEGNHKVTQPCEDRPASLLRITSLLV